VADNPFIRPFQGIPVVFEPRIDRLGNVIPIGEYDTAFRVGITRFTVGTAPIDVLVTALVQ
jgi:hypothetical protein